MQAGFSIVVLPRKTDIIGDGFSENLCLAKGQEGGFPDKGASGVHNLLRCAEVIADNVIHPGLRAVQFDCNEVAVLVHIISKWTIVASGFSDQAALEVVVEMGGRAGDGFLHPSAEGIRTIPEFLRVTISLYAL